MSELQAYNRVHEIGWLTKTSRDRYMINRDKSIEISRIQIVAPFEFKQLKID